MHGDDLERVVRRRPFRPFRIALTTNEHFDVVHPEQVIVDSRFAAVGAAQESSSDEDQLIVYWVDLNHIVHVRRL